MHHWVDVRSMAWFDMEHAMMLEVISVAEALMVRSAIVLLVIIAWVVS